MGRRICVCTSGSVFKFLLPSIYHCFKALLDDFNCLAKGELYLSLAFTYKNLGAIPFCFRSLPCKPICEQECPFPNIQEDWLSKFSFGNTHKIFPPGGSRET